MHDLTRQIVACLLSCFLVVTGWPGALRAAGQLPPGESTASRAAGLRLADTGVKTTVTELVFASAFSDTIGYEFPEEETETRSVIKDVALYTIVAGFVAFFIIKVFLEGDTEEAEEPPPGKDIPPTATFNHPIDPRQRP